MLHEALHLYQPGPRAVHAVQLVAEVQHFGGDVVYLAVELLKRIYGTLTHRHEQVVVFARASVEFTLFLSCKAWTSW